MGQSAKSGLLPLRGVIGLVFKAVLGAEPLGKQGVGVSFGKLRTGFNTLLEGLLAHDLDNDLPSPCPGIKIDNDNFLPSS